jgi:hypothetical protein
MSLLLALLSASANTGSVDAYTDASASVSGSQYVSGAFSSSTSASASISGWQVVTGAASATTTASSAIAGDLRNVGAVSTGSTALSAITINLFNAGSVSSLSSVAASVSGYQFISGSVTTALDLLADLSASLKIIGSLTVGSIAYSDIELLQLNRSATQSVLIDSLSDIYLEQFNAVSVATETTVYSDINDTILVYPVQFPLAGISQEFNVGQQDFNLGAQGSIGLGAQQYPLSGITQGGII